MQATIVLRAWGVRCFGWGLGVGDSNGEASGQHTHKLGGPPPRNSGIIGIYEDPNIIHLFSLIITLLDGRST